MSPFLFGGLMNLAIFVFVGLLTFGAYATVPEPCRNLLASGKDWAEADSKPLRFIHPGFSLSADSIYYYYDIPGLVLHLEQNNLSSPVVQVKRFLLEYDPTRFKKPSYFRMLLGEAPLHLTEADLNGNYMRVTSNDNEGQEALGLNIPRPDGRLANILISRSTGKIFGFGALPRNLVLRRLTRLWMTSGEYLAAGKYGRGTWYNSESNFPPPRFTTAANVVPPQNTILEDRLYYGFSAGREVELMVTGSTAILRYNSEKGVEKVPLDLRGKKIQFVGEFIVFPNDNVEDLAATITFYPQALIDNGMYFDHRTDAIMNRGMTAVLPYQSKH